MSLEQLAQYARRFQLQQLTFSVPYNGGEEEEETIGNDQIGEGGFNFFRDPIINQLYMRLS